MEEELKPFQSGVIDDRIDDRDLIYEDLVGAGEPFDWERGYDVEEEISQVMKDITKLFIESQNGSLSCVGQGIKRYGEVLNVFDEGVLRRFSAKDIYSNVRLEGGCAMIADGMKWLVNHGVEEEKYIPSYDNGKAPSEAFMAQKVARNEERARQFRALSYLRCTHNDIDFLAGVIRDNHGLVTSYEGDSYNWSAKFMTPPKKVTFSHCVYAGKAKMINGKKYIGICNSGGTKVGDNGWQWMGEDYFGHLKNIWTVRDLITNKKQTMKIIGDKRDKKQYAQGADGKIHWLFSPALLNAFHNDGTIDKNQVEWRDNLDGLVVGETYAVVI